MWTVGICVGTYLCIVRVTPNTLLTRRDEATHSTCSGGHVPRANVNQWGCACALPIQEEGPHGTILVQSRS